MSTPYKVIDISAWQGDIDFKATKASGIRGVMIRSSYGTENPKQIDKQLANHATTAIAAGMLVGFYHYSYASNIQEAEAEADFCLKCIAPYKKDTVLPVAFDLEENSVAGLGKDYLAKMSIAFCRKIKAAGYKPMLYTNLNWARNYVNMAMIDAEGIDVWLAQYNSVCQYTGKHTMWQYTDHERIAGYGSGVDCSWCYVNYNDPDSPQMEQTQRGPNPSLVFNGKLDFYLTDLQYIYNLKQTAKADSTLYTKVKGETIKQGTSGQLTRWVQHRLSQLGFRCAESGTANSETMASIKQFQAYYQLGQGELGGTDWYYLLQP